MSKVELEPDLVQSVINLIRSGMYPNVSWDNVLNVVQALDRALVSSQVEEEENEE